MRPGRRHFAQALMATGALCSLGVGPSSATTTGCAPGDWGANPSGDWDCETHPGYKILEIFLSGGMSPWETFWLTGGAASPSFSEFGMAQLPLASIDWSANIASAPCRNPPASAHESKLIGQDAQGAYVHWGAAAHPLYTRPDILACCRMVTQFHKLAPHPAAVPFSLSGLALGNPRRAGTGAAVQRRARIAFPQIDVPASYVLHHNTTFAAEAASVCGMHPASSRPLVIQVSSSNDFVDGLGRQGMSAESDQLLLALRGAHRDRLRFQGTGDPVRASGFSGYWVASELLASAPKLKALFPNDTLVIKPNEMTVCPAIDGVNASNIPHAKTMLDAAAHLLSTGHARYVCAIDSGLAGTYDTHGTGKQSHLLQTTGNLFSVLYHLADIIHDGVANPSGTLKLAETMVVVSSEFGRTPSITGAGRDHWPAGYMTLLIGGPIKNGPSILGAIDRDPARQGVAIETHRYSPTDVRGAMLLAAGVDPFAQGNFRLADFSQPMQSAAGSETQMRSRLHTTILGV